MNTKNALGFLVIGVLMRALPSFQPHWFNHLGPDGTSAAATWVRCMGLIIAALGGLYLIRHHAWPSLMRIAAYRANPRRAARSMAMQRSN
jgi:hypothetical protein